MHEFGVLGTTRYQTEKKSVFEEKFETNES